MKAYELLADKKSWTQHTDARNNLGISVIAAHSDAICWCIGGALERIYGAEEGYAKIQILRDQLKVSFLCDWNDHPSRTHEEVVQLLKSFDL